MKREWLQHAILRTASLLAPADQRSEWLEGWRSELWYIPRRGATLFCLGSFRDALWLRRNNLSPVKRSGICLESPLSCLLFLAALSLVSGFILIHLPGPPHPRPWPSRMRLRDVLEGSLAMLLLTSVFLPATGLAMGRNPANGPCAPQASRLRRWSFLALKVVLVQPAMFCGFIVLLWAGRIIPFAPAVGMSTSWVLAFRWILIDQRQRCPVCLRLLTNPVRIGNSSHTFLEWYGAESICSRGHGLQQIPEISTSYSGKQQWLDLDDACSSAFPEAAGVRQR